MDNSADYSQSCNTVVATAWTTVALFFILLVLLSIYAGIIANRRVPAKQESRQPFETAQVKDEVAAENVTADERRLEALGDADPRRMRDIGTEIAAMASLSSEYGVISMKRRYLSRKIICKTVAEVSRRHIGLKITAAFAGSTQEGLGDTLQQVQYYQTSSEGNYLGDTEYGPCYGYAKRPMFSSDLDVMIVPLAVDVGANKDLEFEHVQSKPLSFVKLKPTERGKLSGLHDCLSDSGYLSARKVKELLLEALEHAKSVYCGSSVAVEVEEHGVAVEMKWAEPSVNGDFFETVLIADFTFALRIPDWPRCALDWTERARNWPSQHLTAAIAAGGCHAVAFYRDSSDDDCQWRLSFSRAELILFSALPPHARDMCIALKALFKSRIQPHCPSLSSYHLKTVVLWIAEQAPSNIFSSSESAAASLVKSLALLSDNVRDGRMPHYFVSGHNILPPLSSSEVKAATDAILDAAFYTRLHLTRLRASEAKYLNAKDCLLIQLPGEHIKPESEVQIVIQRQLNEILNAIPNVSEAAPIILPRKSVPVHLLTGRVVRLSLNEHTPAQCLRAYNEIVSAIERENANQMKNTVIWRRAVAARFKTSFANELSQGLVYNTAGSLENASRYVKRVQKYYFVWTLIIAALLLFVIGSGGAIFITLYFCNYNGASSDTDSSVNVYYNGFGEAPVFGFAGAIRGGNRILSDVNYKSLSINKGGLYIRG